MLRLKSSSYRPLHFPELKDTIFFGQEKQYTDAQCAKCPQITEEVRKGNLVVLEQTRESLAPAAPYIPAPVTVPEALMPSAPAEADQPQQPPEWYGKMMEDVRAMVTAQQPQQQAQDASVAPMLQQLLQKMDTMGQNSDPVLAEKLGEISRKIEGISVSGPGIIEGQAVTTARSVMEVYVPSAIRVDDLSNNVNLQTKNLGQGSSVNDALAALKNLKKSQTPPA